MSAEAIQMLRIVDDSGEDCLHDAGRFAPVELSIEAEQSFEIEMA